MKKILFTTLCMACMFTSCTFNRIAKDYGGTYTINLPKGQKLIEATWKDADLWYLTEQMDADYVPKTKTFTEDSEFGVMEGSVIFVESK